MQLLIAIIIGLLAGLHTSTWGMYKDAPYEGFTWIKYFRSTILSMLVALAVVAIAEFELTRAGDMVVLYGVVYVLERALTEYYKTFLREQDQSKYFIPMQFSVQGNVVKSRAARLSSGLAYFIGVLGVIFLVHYLQKSGAISNTWAVQLPGNGLHQSSPNTGKWIALVTVGSLGGWISAFGGAWKDAPKEGFQIFKFFRSPLMALTYAAMLANFTNSYLFICFGGLGYTIGTIETYKTFFFPNRPRGKFTGKEILFPEMLRKRQYFVPLYIAIWVTVITTIIIAFINPHQGLIG